MLGVQLRSVKKIAKAIFSSSIIMNDVAILQSIDDTLKDSPQASQRTIAKNANLSVGMMNAVLRRFVERGWIMIKNMNGCKLSYALTPEGLNELYERGRAFASRTFSAVSNYNDILNKTVEKAKENGKIRVVLYGPSNVRFLIVYTCERLGMEFVERGEDSDVNVSECQGAVCLIGEQVGADRVRELKEAGALALVEMVEEINIE